MKYARKELFIYQSIPKARPPAPIPTMSAMQPYSRDSLSLTALGISRIHHGQPVTRCKDNDYDGGHGFSDLRCKQHSSPSSCHLDHYRQDCETAKESTS